MRPQRAAARIFHDPAQLRRVVGRHVRKVEAVLGRQLGGGFVAIVHGAVVRPDELQPRVNNERQPGGKARRRNLRHVDVGGWGGSAGQQLGAVAEEVFERRRRRLLRAELARQKPYGAQHWRHVQRRA